MLEFWNLAIEELEILGRSRTTRNPVLWGIICGILQIVASKINCIFQCANISEAIMASAVQIAWLFIIYSSTPSVTLIIKTFRHALLAYGTPTLAVFVGFIKPLLEFIAGYFASVVILSSLENHRIAGACMRNPTNCAKTSIHFLILPKIGRTICSSDKTLCYDFCMNVHWFVLAFLAWIINHYFEKLWFPVSRTDDEVVRPQAQPSRTGLLGALLPAPIQQPAIYSPEPGCSQPPSPHISSHTFEHLACLSPIELMQATTALSKDEAQAMLREFKRICCQRCKKKLPRVFS